jgi:hypothetical protein
MAEAFKCDFCGDFKLGEPKEELFKKEHIDRQGTDVIKVADVCAGCYGDLEVEDDG